MGVIGTSCQLCNLPLNFDHYVRSPSLGMYKIFRSSGSNHTWEPDERPVHFAPEHGWLCDAVAVTTSRPPRLVTGTVEDGSLADLFIAEGFGDAVAYHRFCHDLIGAPTAFDSLALGHGTHGWALAETYNGQLYDLRALVDHGKGWMLVDPRGASDDARRSRARIEAIRARALTPPQRVRPSTVADILAADRDWNARMIRKNDTPTVILRYRASVTSSLDCATYPALVWAMKEWEEGGGMCNNATLEELEHFERAVKTAVEAHAGAILLMVTIGDGQMQLIMQARDEAATRAKIEALPQGTVPLSFDNEHDPTWHVYFTNLSPHSR